MTITTSAFEALAFTLGREENGVDILKAQEIRVISLGAEDVRPAPKLGTAFDADFLLGIGVTDGRMLILLDIERLMSSEELDLVERDPVERDPVERLAA